MRVTPPTAGVACCFTCCLPAWACTRSAPHLSKPSGRRPVGLSEGEPRQAELEQHTVDMDKMESTAAPYFQGVDVVFCALGTTRKVQGGGGARPVPRAVAGWGL